jgi:hypothetical protein
MATSNNSAIKVGFNLYINRRFDSSVLNVLTLEQFKQAPELINLVMPPSGKDGVSIPTPFLPVLQAAGFNGIVTYGDLRTEYGRRTSRDGIPKNGTTNHSMFTTYQSSLVWSDGTCFSSDMSPLAFKFIENFSTEGGSVSYEVGNNLFFLPADMVEEFMNDASGDYSTAYNEINNFLKSKKDIYRFKMNWELSSLSMVQLYKYIQAKGLRALGVIVDATVNYDPKTSAVSSVVLSPSFTPLNDSFDFSEGTKLTLEDVAANHAAIQQSLTKVQPLSPFASGGWKKVQSGEITQSKNQRRKADKKAESNLSKMASTLLSASPSTSVTESIDEGSSMDSLDTADC